MTKKPLEELLEELKTDLEDAILVLNELKTEVPKEIKQEIKTIWETQSKKLKKINQFIEKAKQILENLEASTEEIRNDLSSLNEELIQLYRENLNQVENLLNEIQDLTQNLLVKIEKSAKEGAYSGTKEGLKEYANKVSYQLTELIKIANKITAILNKHENEISVLFKKYQWSWLGPFLFTSLLLGLGIIYIGLQNANKEKASEILIGLLKISFILFNIFIFWEFAKKYISNFWISISLISALFIESFLITFSTLKNKIQIIRKEEIIQACDYPKPNQIIKDNKNNPCYIYKNQKSFRVYWYSSEGNTWYRATEVAICKIKN